MKPRIVSLLPSSTEIVSALGFEGQLVGRSHECDYPPSTRHLPVCTAPKFNPVGSSVEIDQRVRNLLAQAGSVYQVDTDLLERLRPDVIVTQSQCEVCAVSFREVEQAACQLISSRPHLVNLEPNQLNDIWEDIQKVAQALDTPQSGIRLVEQLQESIAGIHNRTRHLFYKPRVVTIEWLSPLMCAANWVPEMVEIAGGDNVFGSRGAHSHYLDWAQVAEADPDYLIVMPCGFDIARTLQEMPLLTFLPGWKRLKAVEKHQVIVTDGNQYFNRPGPRLLDSIEILAEILHPDVFPARHYQSGWISLPDQS